MKHTEAAARGNGLALRYDNSRLVLYSAKLNEVIIAKDAEGSLWETLDAEIAERYRDWEPAKVLWYERVLYEAGRLWDKIKTEWRKICRI